MAEPAQALKQAAAPRPGASRTAGQSAGTRVDFASIGGFLVAFSGIIGGLILEKGSLQDVAQTTAAMIVLGGTIGAVLVTTPMPVFRRALKGLASVFFESAASAGDMIETLIQFAAKA